MITQDKDLLRDVSQYRYYTANKFVSQKEKDKVADQIKRKRMLL